MASPRVALSPIKVTTHRDIHNLGKKPLPESALKELKIEIVNLVKEDKKSRYLLGQKLDLLQKERARGRTGTFMKDLREMRIGYPKANRAIKFYRKAQAFIAFKRAENAKLDAKWGGIEDVADFEHALASESADKRLAAINVLADMEREKVRQAQAARANGKAPSYKVGLFLSDGQKERFQKAWKTLDDTERTAVIYKAILDAAKK